MAHELSRLSKWMAEQALLGVGASALRSWAVEGGFPADRVDEEVARLASSGAFEPRGALACVQAEAGAWRSPHGPRCAMWMKFPEIGLFEGVVDGPQAAGIMAAASEGLADSLVALPLPGRARGRSSSSKTFAAGECAQADRLQGTLAKLLGIPPARMEPLQATLYGPGGFYAPHHDGFPRGHPRSEGPSRRVASVVVYLASPESGGQTVIEPLGLRISPREGSALYFAYPDDLSREMTLHASAPCSGGKWIATQWVVAGRPEADGFAAWPSR